MSYLDFAPEDCATDPDLKEEGSEAETSKLPQDLIRPTLYMKYSAYDSSTVKCSFFATILYIALLNLFKTPSLSKHRNLSRNLCYSMKQK